MFFFKLLQVMLEVLQVKLKQSKLQMLYTDYTQIILNKIHFKYQKYRKFCGITYF